MSLTRGQFCLLQKWRDSLKKTESKTKRQMYRSPYVLVVSRYDTAHIIHGTDVRTEIYHRVYHPIRRGSTIESATTEGNMATDLVRRPVYVDRISSDRPRRHEHPDHTQESPETYDVKRQCVRFNQSECRTADCMYDHTCFICEEAHAIKACPHVKGKKNT